MQKVERKQHRERRKNRWILPAAAFLLLACSITAAVLLFRAPEEAPEREERHWGMLIDRQADELVSVTVQRRGDRPWTLVRTVNGILMPENESGWTVAEQQDAILQESVTQLRYEEILTEDPAVYRDAPESFGLAEPLVNVTARYTDGTETVLHIGNDTGLEDGWHYLTVEGDDRLYAVSSAVAEDLNVEYAVLRPVPRPEIYSALLDTITVTDGGKTSAEWKLQGQVIDRDAGSNWTVTVPFRYPADEEAIQNIKKSAENIRLGVYTAPATEENLRQYGFNASGRTLVFHMAAGSTGTVGETGVYDVTEHPESTVSLSIGNDADELACYVRFVDEIYTVSTFTLSAFTSADPMGTTARYPVLTPLDSLESVTVEENGKRMEYLLQEKEQEDTQGEKERLRTCLLNGRDIPWESFEAAYNRLLTVTFSGTLPDGAQWENPYKKYTFRTLSGGTHTVELCNWDGMHDAVTVDGYTLFYLIRGGMTALPEDPGTESR